MYILFSQIFDAGGHMLRITLGFKPRENIDIVTLIQILTVCFHFFLCLVGCTPGVVSVRVTPS